MQIYMDKATQLALALKANIVILKRQLAETEDGVAERAPCLLQALPASTNSCFVYTNKQGIVEHESKEEQARKKRARTATARTGRQGPTGLVCLQFLYGMMMCLEDSLTKQQAVKV